MFQKIRQSVTRGGAIAACIVLLATALPMQLLRSARVYADNAAQTWSDTSAEPLVSNGNVLDYTNLVNLRNTHLSVTGDLACYDESLPLGPAGSDNASDFGCWYGTKIGQIREGGYDIRLANQPYVGYVDSFNSQIYPTPNPDVFIEAVPDTDNPSLYHLYFRTADQTAMVPAPTDWQYPIYYEWKDAENSIKQLLVNGQPLLVDDNVLASQISYSNNHQWMSIWDERGFVVRVNLSTFEADVAFVNDHGVADNLNYAETSVSDSGRYVAVLTYDDSQMPPTRIIDFNACSDSAPQGKLKLPFCATRFVDQDVRVFANNNLQGADYVQFNSDDVLEYYANDPTDPTGNSYDEYFVRAPHTWQSNYIALGDSYASGEGEGNSNFYSETDIHGVNMCHLAKNSYPFLIGKDLGLDSVHSVACSGAKTTNIANGSGIDKTLTLPDRDNQYYDNGLDFAQSWTPGYTAQVNYVKQYQPNIITVSIGGNNIGFSNILTNCLGVDTCYGSYEDRTEIVNLIDSQFNTLVDLYTTLKQNTAPDARIYVIGYPSIIKADGQYCGGNVHLDYKERIFANDLEDYLNAVIKLAAQKAGVFYVDTTTAFYGHRLCEVSADTGEAAVNGITFGHDSPITLGPITTPDILSKGSFHPTVLGHEKLEERIEKATDNFTTPLPRADTSISGPILDDSTALLQAPKNGRAMNEIVYDDTAGQIIYQGVETHISYQAGNDPYAQLQPNTSVKAMLHSEPIDLGMFTTDSAGNIDASIAIPSSVSPDFHSIDLYAMGRDGVMHDIRRTVYVAASPDDYDGDGTVNSQEPCLIFEVPIGQIHGSDYACTETTMPEVKPVSNELSLMLHQSRKSTPPILFADTSYANALPNGTANLVPADSLPTNQAHTVPDQASVHIAHGATESMWWWLGASVFLAIILTLYLLSRYTKV